MNKTRNNALQSLCREYLRRLLNLARKHGLGGFVSSVIESNERGECVGTEEEVALLSRACDDERLSRKEVPKILGKSYRETVEGGDFEKIEKLRRVGIYSKVSALLIASEEKNKTKEKDDSRE